MYSNLVLIPVGFVFNNLCLITFVKSKISQSPTGLTLTYLSMADNIVLVSVLFGIENWSKYIGIPSIVTKHTSLGQGSGFLVNVGFFFFTSYISHYRKVHFCYISSESQIMEFVSQN